MNQTSDDTLVAFGGEVKALGNGKVGGYLVLFGAPETKDLAGDFFASDTDYGPHKTSLVFYQHGQDETLKRRELDKGAALKIDDVGVWVEAQLDMRDEYEQAMYSMAKSSKLGWSSGTAAHLVEREQVGNAYKITKWPLGLDASLTPTPCDPRNVAVPLKSLLPEIKASNLSEQLTSSMAIAAASRAYDELYWSLSTAVWNEEKPLKDRLNDLRACFDDCRDICVRVIKAILTSAPKDDQKSAALALTNHLKSGVLTAPDFDDHSDTVLAAVKEYSDRAALLIERRTRDGRIVSQERRDAIKALHEHIGTLIKLAEPPASVNMNALKVNCLLLEAEILDLLPAGNLHTGV